MFIYHENLNAQNMSAGSKEKTDLRNDECGTSYLHITEANPDQIVETHDDNAGVWRNCLVSLKF